MGGTTGVLGMARGINDRESSSEEERKISFLSARRTIRVRAADRVLSYNGIEIVLNSERKGIVTCYRVGDSTDGRIKVVSRKYSSEHKRFNSIEELEDEKTIKNLSASDAEYGRYDKILRSPWRVS